MLHLGHLADYVKNVILTTSLFCNFKFSAYFLNTSICVHSLWKRIKYELSLQLINKIVIQSYVLIKWQQKRTSIF